MKCRCPKSLELTDSTILNIHWLLYGRLPLWMKIIFLIKIDLGFRSQQTAKTCNRFAKGLGLKICSKSCKDVKNVAWSFPKVICVQFCFLFICHLEVIYCIHTVPSVFLIMQMICRFTCYAVLRTHRNLNVITTISESCRSESFNIFCS